MRLLLTRPKAQAASMAHILRTRGHIVSLAPMLRVTPLQFDRSLFEQASAVVVTSANAAPAVADLSPASSCKVFAVGPDTAEALKRVGINDVVFADATAEGLLSFITSNWRPRDGPLIYASGREVSVDISAHLNMRGYACSRVPVYAAEPSHRLPDSIRRRLLNGQLDAALFMSARTAETFVRLATSSSVADCCGSLVSVSLSDKIAEVLAPISWKASVVAASPTRVGILTAVETLDRRAR